MTLIIAARFPTFDVAHAAAQRLMQAGVHESALHVFFVNAKREVKRSNGHRGVGVAAHGKISTPSSRQCLKMRRTRPPARDVPAVLSGPGMPARPAHWAAPGCHSRPSGHP